MESGNLSEFAQVLAKTQMHPAGAFLPTTVPVWQQLRFLKAGTPAITSAANTLASVFARSLSPAASVLPASLGKGPGSEGHPLRLADYPRPAGDNGRGMHWVPTLSSTPDVVDRFVQEMVEMKIKWAVVLNGGTDAGRNDYLIKQLVEKGIMPIMRVYTPDLTPLENENDLTALVRHYRALGVQYFQLYNEPNLRLENGGRAPDVQRYLDQWIPAARTVTAAGGLPGFGALSPGGDVDDLEFFQSALREIKRRGAKDVLDRAWVSVHNYTGDHPIADTGDGWGFYRYRRYADLMRQELGRTLPLIGTEGGTHAGGSISVARQAEMVRDAYRAMSNVEPYNFAYTYWLIANAEGGGKDQAFEQHALFQPGRASPVVDALKELA